MGGRTAVVRARPLNRKGVPYATPRLARGRTVLQSGCRKAWTVWGVGAVQVHEWSQQLKNAMDKMKKAQEAEQKERAQIVSDLGGRRDKSSSAEEEVCSDGHRTAAVACRWRPRVPTRSGPLDFTPTTDGRGLWVGGLPREWASGP